MQASAKQRYVRISPTKVRQVAAMIKGIEVEHALALLKFSPKAGAAALHKLVTDAQANAYQAEGSSRNKKLFVRNAIVDEGPSMKRVRPRARGSRDIIKKRTSHIVVLVDDGGND